MAITRPDGEHRLPALPVLSLKSYLIAEPLDRKELATIDDLAVSSMWEIAALVEVLERKGVLTRQKPLQMIQA